MVFSNEDKIIIENDYKEKSWSAYKIWKNHPSKKWDYSSVKRLLKKKISETGSMDRIHGSGRPRIVSTEDNKDLIEEFVFSQEERPHTQLALRKMPEQTVISRSLTWKMVKRRNLKEPQTISIY